MTQDEWHDLFFFLIETDHEDNPVEEKDASYIRLAAHMAKLETELENLKQRVSSLEAQEVEAHEQEILYGVPGAPEPGVLHVQDSDIHRLEWNSPDKGSQVEISDKERIDWLEAQARKSQTGISFDWIPSAEGEPSGYRFMRKHHIGEPLKTIRKVIDQEIHRAKI